MREKCFGDWMASADLRLNWTQTSLRLTIRGFPLPSVNSAASSGSDRSAFSSGLCFRIRSLNYIRGVFPYVSASACAFIQSQSTSPHSRSGRAHALEPLSLIAAHNRCASGVHAALPAYPFPRLTLTSGMSQFGPASGSHRDSGPHHYCCLEVRSVRFSASFEFLL